jgi:Notch-like protein
LAFVACSDDSTSPASGCADLACGSNGICSESGDAGGPHCACDDGYAGAECDRCASGYALNGSRCVQVGQTGPECEADSCSGNGDCSETAGDIVCACDEGYAGDSCDECDDGYHEGGGDCVQDEQCTPRACPDNSSCDDSTGSIECECDDGFRGADCDMCAAGYHADGDDCVEDTSCTNSTCANGTCSDSSGVPACACSGGWSGEHCDECGDGFHEDGSDCLQNEVCAQDSCPTHAECDDTTGVITCACMDGHAGDDCDECVAPRVMDETGACVEVACDPGLTPNGQGECTLECDDAATAVNVAGVDSSMLQVPDGYEFVPPSSILFPDGSTLELHTVGTFVCLPLGYTCDQFDPCGGDASVGVCEDESGLPTCVCSDGYTGLLCTDCAPGYHADGADCLLDETCPATPCTGRGTCDDSSGEALCSCQAGYSGATCESCATGYHAMGDGSCVVDEACVAGACMGHGSCHVTAGLAGCNCFAGYTGDDCSTCVAGYHPVGAACAIDETCSANSCSGIGV